MAPKPDRLVFIFAMAATILAIMTWVASPKPESDSATPARGTIYLPQHWNAY